MSACDTVALRYNYSHKCDTTHLHIMSRTYEVVKLLLVFACVLQDM